MVLSVVQASRGQLQFLINEGGGQFSDRTSSFLSDPGIESPQESTQRADVNGDGLLDLIVRCGTKRPVYLNDGQGHFVNLPQSFLGITNVFNRAAAADFNGDGRMDFFVEKGSAFIMLQLAPARTQIGTAQDDALLGGSLADTLTSGVGADVIYGGDGADLAVWRGRRRPHRWRCG